MLQNWIWREKIIPDSNLIVDKLHVDVFQNMSFTLFLSVSDFFWSQ